MFHERSRSSGRETAERSKEETEREDKLRLVRAFAIVADDVGASYVNVLVNAGVEPSRPEWREGYVRSVFARLCEAAGIDEQLREAYFGKERYDAYWKRRDTDPVLESELDGIHLANEHES